MINVRVSILFALTLQGEAVDQERAYPRHRYAKAKLASKDVRETHLENKTRRGIARRVPHMEKILAGTRDSDRCW